MPLSRRSTSWPLTFEPLDTTNNLFRDTAAVRVLSENIRTAERARPRDYDSLEATLVQIATDSRYDRVRSPRKGRDQYNPQVKRDDILALHAELIAGLDAFVRDSG